MTTSLVRVSDPNQMLVAVQRDMAALEKATSVGQINDIRARNKMVANSVEARKLCLPVAQASGRAYTAATEKLAKLYDQEIATPGQRNDLEPRADPHEVRLPGKQAIEEVSGISRKSFQRLKPLVDAKDDTKERAKAAIEAAGEVVTPGTLIKQLTTGGKGAGFSSMSEEWYTPQEYIEAARDVLGAFDLDPASNETANKTVKAARFFTKEDNGLLQPWSGRVWCNPPYGDEETGGTGAWVNKAIEEYLSCRMSDGILLVNAVTDRKWFQPLFDYVICLTNHRIKFYTSKGTPESPISGNAFVYFGKDNHKFASAFDQFGAVVVRVRS